MHYQFEHHKESVEKVIEYFYDKENIIALILGGSIAHGFASEKSDIDIMIVIDDTEYNRRKKNDDLLFLNVDLCTYPKGYVDGKYITEDYIKLVIEKGNEPTRYAFKDCEVLISNSSEIESLVYQASRFQKETKERNGKKFYAQMHAWKWFYYEAVKTKNEFLLSTALSNFILYASRAILNHNEMLYPYFKWLLAEVERAKFKPANIVNDFNALLEKRQPEKIEDITNKIRQLKDWQVGDWDWPKHFLNDVETVWMHQEPFVSDL